MVSLYLISPWPALSTLPLREDFKTNSVKSWYAACDADHMHEHVLDPESFIRFRHRVLTKKAKQLRLLTNIRYTYPTQQECWKTCKHFKLL